MLQQEDLKYFENKLVKLVKKGKYSGFALYGRILSIAKESLIFETQDGVRSIISLDAIEEIVERTKGRHEFDY